jgi:hypothetical protein
MLLSSPIINGHQNLQAAEEKEDLSQSKLKCRITGIKLKG